VPKQLAPVALLVAAAFALGACGGDDGSDSADGEETAEAVDTPCESVELPAPQEFKLDPPPRKPSAEALTAVVETSCGTFEIALDTKENPMTAASFEYQAENGVFDGTPFHRIIPDYVIQGGDPAGTGLGPGPGYFVDEPPPDDTSYTEGVVAMAKTEAEPPGRSGSQFFVVTVPDAALAPDFAVAGEVTKGMEVVDAIEALGSPDGSGSPLEPVVIDSVTIEAG
jgi:peptidyl-prolyl cis-trans isomerase B (cyclophilin B)